MTNQKKHSVLIVDDETMNIRALTQILSPEYTVYVEKNGRNTVESAEKIAPDVILLDIIMPEMNGYEVLAALKHTKKTKDIPVIFISGLDDEESEEKGLILGAADYITKPFSPAVVKLRLQNQIKIISQRLTEYDLMKYRLMSNALNVALWDMDTSVVASDPVNRSNQILYSPEFRAMAGFEHESDFPNRLGSWSDRLHIDDVEKTIHSFAAHINDYTGKTPYDVEFRMRVKSGEYRHFRAFGDTLRGKDGVPRRTAGAIIDITEKKATEKLAKQQAEADMANRAKSTFLANMSHEIRTPMNTILGVTEILLQNQRQNHRLSNDVTDGLEKIYAACNLLLGIINDILDFSKIEAGKLDIIPEQYGVASLINDSVNMNIMRLEDKPIAFELQVDENIPALLVGDELRIKQILNNLLSNAFKYTEAGKIIMSVCANSAITANTADCVTLVLSVKDTGPGMSNEQLKKLFDEYSRFNKSAQNTIQGTGLGMSITRRLVKLMGGEIIVESELGKGTTFTVCLPQKTTANSAVLGREAAENLRDFQTNSLNSHAKNNFTREPMPYGKVLVVDDVETNIYVAAGLMKLYKLQIDTARGGNEAIEKVRSGKVYDIVFMDHMMPEPDGIATTKTLRELNYSGTIVALTANAIAGQADIFLHNGFDDFLSKPIDIRRLNTILNKYIRDKQPIEIIEAARAADNLDSEIQLSENLVSEPQITTSLDLQIPGVDSAKGLEKFGGDEKIYLKVLRVYAANIRKQLDELGAVDVDNLRPYEISVHGIKGSSFDIYADSVGEKAKSLEQAAKTSDTDFIAAHNAALLEELGRLADEIDTAVSAYESRHPKPSKDKPDSDVLARLYAACEMYSMDQADAAMEEIEQYDYTADDGLAQWLREKVDLIKFSEITDRLKT
ncbi:MAG: response regulator [Oscillospiraceae bacterium]|nr:response regulator [Oscillospiraceae bacterium]